MLSPGDSVTTNLEEHSLVESDGLPLEYLPPSNAEPSASP
jgi:hypothetical protein